ncbi:MAG: Manganese transport system ATP-binding protein MntB [Chlamydiae bacterium]|nr:Manganese transport system ATP-binding protein MntB [Chlamydiota bacterium]
MIEAIRINHVDFQYNDTPILKEISCVIRPGEFVHIIGPNGGGKTTLLKLIMGFIPPSSGSIAVLGKSPTQARTSIAYVPQVFPFDRLFPISVFEVVLSGRLSKLPWHGRYSDKDKKMALSAIEEVGLTNYKDQSMGSLSGGQLQRALIARALATKPKILILDEPTSCIDFAAQLEIDTILKRLKRRMTILMVTHDLDHIGKGSDRVLCIHGQLYPLKPEEVCQHFSMGLYQKPEKTSLAQEVFK